MTQSTQPSAHLGPEYQPLWSEGAPGALGAGPLHTPAITVHLPDPEHATGAAVVVAPGGGYRVLASDHEGLLVARFLVSHGIAAFVLRYRVGPDYHSDVSIADGMRAIRTVRCRAREFRVNPERIGLLGFSAGGHLTAAVGTRATPGDAQAPDPVERHSARPDFLVPVYAVTNGTVRGRKASEYTATDTEVTALTPPAFVVATHEDSIVPANQSLIFYDALRRAGVEAELHVFGYGEHGAGLGEGDPDLAEWPGMLLRWLRSTGMLTEHARVAVSGRVSVASQPLGIAWVTLTPADPRAPIARVKINRGAAGEFNIPASHGAVPGPHSLEVTHVSDQYPHTADGAFTVAGTRTYRAEVNLVVNQRLEVDF